MKIKITLLIITLVFSVEILFSVTAVAEKEKEIYTVKQGDTLWSIAEQFYKEPKSWKKIYTANPKIKNPNLIHPGEQLVIPLVEEKVVTEKKETEELEIKPVTEMPSKITPPVSVLPQVSTIEVMGLEKKEKIKKMPRSFLVSEDWQFDGFVKGEQEKKILISAGDTVYLDIGSKKGLKPKMQCLVCRKGGKVYHPQTGKLLGRTIESIGLLEVTEKIQDNSSTARVITSNEAIRVGDWVKIITEK